MTMPPAGESPTPRRLEKEIELDATPEQVWEAIATGPGLATWFMSMEMPIPEGDTLPPGVAVWDPPRHLLISPPAPDGATQSFEYLIEGREGGSTVLRYVQSGFTGNGWETEYEAMKGGWDMYFHTLAEYFRYFAGRSATYVTAEAPPASVPAAAWQQMLAALGIPDGVEQGAAVRLTPDGLAPIEGVADYYVAGDFLGVRTSDALFRFHGRALLDMPIAVGHHLYAPVGVPDTIDGAAAAKDWQAWLERAFA
jgi:hypothetical protein